MTISETGKTVVYDIVYGSQEFNSVEEAVDLYWMLVEPYDDEKKNNPNHVESDNEKEIRYILFQLESYNTEFTGEAKRKFDNAQFSQKITH